ncbi:MAG: Si-specific NAD(P)(+) transhydrogenase [Chthoniobacteraceae bacterium]
MHSAPLAATEKRLYLVAMSDSHFDLIVLGGGPAGCSGGLAAAAFGKRVALVETETHIGGAGLNTGTIPSKALRESALVISGWRARKLLGIDLSLSKSATVGDFMRHEIEVRDTIQRQFEHRMSWHGIERMHGRGAFVDPHTVRVTTPDGGQQVLSGDVILIATGSSPAHPPEFPFEHPHVHDSNEILEITELPRKLVVIGAGVIGAEYACTFAALGVEVHLVDGRDVLLPFLDHEVSATIAATMKRAGVQFHWGERVTECAAPECGDVVLTFASGATLAASDVLVAAGRNRNTDDLALDAAGLVAGKRGLIVVNEFYQTTAPHIYAAGDVVGPPALAATGIEQARVAVSHAFGILKKEASTLLPTGIYTIPEASMVGKTEAELKEAGVAFIVGRAAYDLNPRGRLIGDNAGFLKLLFRADDLRLLGVHVVGEQATELIHIGLIAMLCGGDADLFNRACFNYPTLGDLYKHAAYDAIFQHSTGRALKT